MKTRIEIKVRGYHTDVFGHVNHARYIEFMEEGRWDYFEKNNLLELFARGINHAVVNININYYREAKIGEVLRIETEIKETKERSFIIKQNIYSGNNSSPITSADFTEVFTEAGSGKVIPVNNEIKELWPELAGAG